MKLRALLASALLLVATNAFAAVTPLGFGGVPFTDQPLVNVVQGGDIPVSASTPITGKAGFKGRHCYLLGPNPSHDIRIGWVNYYQTNDATQETSNPYDIIFSKVAVVYGGVMHTVAFSTVRNFTLLSGATISWSDSIAPATWDIQAFSAGAQFEVRWEGTEPSDTATMAVPTSGQTNANTLCNQEYLFDQANAVDDVDATGAMALPSGGSGLALIATPAIIIGRFNQPTVSLLHVGDSICYGSNDTIVQNSWGGGSFLRRAAETNGFPYTNMCRIGNRAEYFAGQFTKRSALFPYFNIAIDELGTNDFAASTALATMQGYEHTIWTALRSGGVQKIYHTTLIPRVSLDTSYGTTLASQTAVSGFTNGGLRDQFNTALASDVNLDGVIDVAPAVQDGSDHTKWPLRSYLSTLSAATLINDTSMSVLDLPTRGECLVLEPGGANAETTGRPILTVTGTGPWTVDQPQGLTIAHSSGASVKSTNTVDGIHPCPFAHAAISAIVAPIEARFTVH